MTTHSADPDKHWNRGDVTKVVAPAAVKEVPYQADYAFFS